MWGQPLCCLLPTLLLWGGRGLRAAPQGPASVPDHQKAGPECVPLVPSRVGQRGSGLSMSAARSEHEVSEIIDGLSEQEVSAGPDSGLSSFSLASPVRVQRP